MTPVREAFVLPLIFLTVSLLGGVRIAADVRFVPPSLAALVLAMILLAALVRSGALAPARLMDGRRAPLENASGVVALLALFAGSAQAFHLLTPDAGLLFVAFSLFFFVQLLATTAGGADRTGLLRALGVLFGSAFILRWIALEALYAPGGGMLKRVVTALAEGFTLGSLDYAPHAAVNGYLAFAALVLFLAGLAMLPGESGTSISRIERAHRPSSTLDITADPTRDLRTGP